MTPVSTNKIVFDKGIPKKNYFILGILYMKILVLLYPFRSIVQKYLKNCQNCTFSPGFMFFYGKNLYAKHVVFNDTFFLDYAPIYIGEVTKFSFQNMVITGSHDKDNFEKVIAKPISIGKNVWITSRCIILPGVTIGDNSVIGAGSVVTQDIPANCLAMGNPAKVIKYY